MLIRMCEKIRKWTWPQTGQTLTLWINSMKDRKEKGHERKEEPRRAWKENKVVWYRKQVRLSTLLWLWGDMVCQQIDKGITFHATWCRCRVWQIFPIWYHQRRQKKRCWFQWKRKAWSVVNRWSRKDVIYKEFLDWEKLGNKTDCVLGNRLPLFTISVVVVI